MLTHAHFFYKQPEPVVYYHTDVETHIDTVYVPKPVEIVKYVEIPAKLDTQLVAVDPLSAIEDDVEEFVPAAVATMDTVFLNYGHLFVNYTFPPKNEFDLLFHPEPPRIELRTVTLTKHTPLPWYKSRTVAFLGGVALTCGIVWVTNQ